MTDVTVAPALRAAPKARHRAAILDAAARLIAERGSPKFSVAELAESAEVSRRTVFNHFASLDEVITTVCARAIERTIEASRGAVDPPKRGGHPLPDLFEDLSRMLAHSDFPTVIVELATILHGEDGGESRLVATVFAHATDTLRSLAAQRGPDVGSFELDIMVGSLMNGIRIISERWITASRGALDGPSRDHWDELLARMIGVVRAGYAAPASLSAGSVPAVPAVPAVSVAPIAPAEPTAAAAGPPRRA